MTDFINATQNGVFNYTSPNQRYIIGGMAELHLPFGLGVEFDALYRHLEYHVSGNLVDVFVTGKTTASNWEFPLVLKYRFPFPVARPYVESGIAWNALSGVSQTFSSAGPVSGTSNNPLAVNRTFTEGWVLGAGVDIHAIFLHISPELRYTRWFSAPVTDFGGLLQASQNQAEFLVGITF
jgi:hypothetical protein